MNNTPITVSELNTEIKNLIDGTFDYVFVTGEISNFRRVFPSGHCYFLLKDESSQISCNLWNFRYESIDIRLMDGIKVNVKGKISVYHPRGTYSIDITSVEEAGKGSLQAAFEELKKKLSNEGLFEEKFKKPLPQYPETVAVITSETGAVIEDFKKIAARRYPLVKIILIPAVVQGAESPKSVCSAIQKANNLKPQPDFVVIARGGGSIEDLWTFNEESVARAVFNSEIPIVSAIGHETDYTICDFTADLRAPTPSAAAEMVFPDISELLERLEQIKYYMHSSVRNRTNALKHSIENIEKSYIFRKPKDILFEYRIKLDELSESLVKSIHGHIQDTRKKISYLERILENLSPDRILKRGFTFVEKEGRIIVSKKDLKSNDFISINFHDGKKNANIID